MEGPEVEGWNCKFGERMLNREDHRQVQIDQPKTQGWLAPRQKERRRSRKRYQHQTETMVCASLLRLYSAKSGRENETRRTVAEVLGHRLGELLERIVPRLTRLSRRASACPVRLSMISRLRTSSSL